jgi:hypothetical protein
VASYFEHQNETGLNKKQGTSLVAAWPFASQEGLCSMVLDCLFL